MYYNDWLLSDSSGVWCGVVWCGVVWRVACLRDDTMLPTRTSLQDSIAGCARKHSMYSIKHMPVACGRRENFSQKF
jgi:hypothetical protein